MKKFLLLFALLCALPASATTTNVVGTKVLNGSGGLLSAGQWCLGATCFTVTNGVIAASSSVTSATGTVTVTNGSGTTYLTVPSVAVTGTTFNWDTFVLATSATASGIGAPRLACQVGATYTQTDASSLLWNAINQTGTCVWSSGGSATPWPSGTYANNGVPTASCVSPCSYIRLDASPSSAATYAIVAPANTISTNWVQQGYAGSSTPALDVKIFLAAVCDAGQASAASMTRYDSQMPQAGCDASSTSTSGYLAFQHITSTPYQYAELKLLPRNYWTGTGVFIRFETAATTGNVNLIIDSACVPDGVVPSSASFGTAQTISIPVSSTTGLQTTSTMIANVAVPGTNGCATGNTTGGVTTLGSTVIIRVHRALSDTAAADAQVLSVITASTFSQ